MSTMDDESKPLLGLCPIGKFVFSHEDALRQKRAVQKKLKSWGVRFVDLEGVLPDGIVRDQAHVDRAVSHFQSLGIDGVFMPHCNFGTEGAVGMIGRKLGVPVLLWGPRDEAPLQDGSRLRDSLCGLFASSKVLHKLGVPFTYIENVRARVAKGHPGYAKEATKLSRTAMIEGFADHEPLIRILAVRDQLLALAADHGLDGLAIQDFTSLVDAMGTYCFFANSLVSETIPVACESDVHGAISAILLHRAALGAPVFLADITIRHPDDDNGVLLWHAGAPVSMMKPGAKIRLGHHWILPSPLAGMPHFPLQDGALTLARFDGDGGRYRLAVGEGQSMAGPDTLNNYLWMKVDHWARWERILMEGPFIHHAGMAYGHLGKALIELCRYVPGLEPVRLNEGGAT